MSDWSNTPLGPSEADRQRWAEESAERTRKLIEDAIQRGESKGEDADGLVGRLRYLRSQPNSKRSNDDIDDAIECAEEVIEAQTREIARLREALEKIENPWVRHSQQCPNYGERVEITEKDGRIRPLIVGSGAWKCALSYFGRDMPWRYAIRARKGEG